MSGESDLALLGGTPVLAGQLPAYPSIGSRELAALERVIESGSLSGFLGSWGPEFDGGRFVREFEQAWCERFAVGHAVSVNSATSGLCAAVGAARVGPGDEVIVPPYTMSATAVAPLMYGGVPVFADIDAEDFCIDPASVREAITPRTKAIIAVNLFGHPARLAELSMIAREHDCVLIEDNSQAPLASEDGRYAGTIGDIGVFSLNRHKHIQTGEGGICVTNDEDMALRLRLIRNHGENAVDELGITDITNLIGFNLRMTELVAAVALEQLRDIDRHVRRRVEMAERLTAAFTGLEGLMPPITRYGCHHVYYIWAFRYSEEVVGVSRELFSEALAAEGIPHEVGYVRPLYMLPTFQRRIALGADGYPFNLSDQTYPPGLCPVAERMYERELMLFEICAYDAAADFADVLARGVRKVYDGRAALRGVTPGSQEGVAESSAVSART